MGKKDIIIIGAGLGGLSTGVYAQTNGYNSKIFEQHRVCGGLAATWKRKDYNIDGGIHFLTGHKPHIDFYRILTEIGANNYNFVDMKTYARYIDEKTGIRIDFTHDLQQIRHDLLKLFPSDQAMIEELISDINEFKKHDLSTFGFDKPVELIGLREKVKDIWVAKSILKFFVGKYNETIRTRAKRVSNEVFTDILMYLFLPDVPYWFIIMILSTLVTDQMCLLGNGSNEFARCIETKYTSLGGKISYNSPVKRIVVENDTAVGIELENGETKFANYIISAADGYNTIYSMLNGQFTNAEINERYIPKKELPPYICVSYGVSREFKEEPWLVFKKLERPLKIGKQDIFEFTYRIFNYSDFFAPEGKTVIQAMFETEWDFWNTLKDDQDSYKLEKEKISRVALKKLEEIYPGITETVEITDVATPYTYWRYTRSHKGSIMGFSPTAESILEQFKKTLPGLDNFYMAGHWSMSMGGVPTAIFSGRHAIQLICKKDKKKFIV